MLLHEEKIRAKLDKLEAITKVESSEFEDYVTNHALPMILVDENGHILYWNRRLGQLIGKTLKEVKGKIARDIIYENVEDFERVFQIIMEDGCITGSEALLKTKDGPRTFKIYSNIHRDENGKWLNSRCVFVPAENGLMP